MPEGDPNAIVAKLQEIADLLRELITDEQRPQRRLLRLSEAADYLHISPWQLRGIIHSGELPIIRAADHTKAPWLLDKVELDHWVERSKVKF